MSYISTIQKNSIIKMKKKIVGICHIQISFASLKFRLTVPIMGPVSVGRKTFNRDVYTLAGKAV